MTYILPRHLFNMCMSCTKQSRSLSRPACIDFYKAISKTFTCYMSLGFPISTSLEHNTHKHTYAYTIMQINIHNTNYNVTCNFHPKQIESKNYSFIDKNGARVKRNYNHNLQNKPEKCRWINSKRICPMKLKATAIISPMQIFVYRIIAHFFILFSCSWTTNYYFNVRDSYYNFEYVVFFYEIQSSHSRKQRKKNGAKFAICITKNEHHKRSIHVCSIVSSFIFIWHSINIASHCIILLKLLNNVMINF